MGENRCVGTIQTSRGHPNIQGGCPNVWGYPDMHGVYVTFGNIYQKYYQCLCPHVDPHLSPPTAQQWVSMCIKLICVHIDHLEVLAGIEME